MELAILRPTYKTNCKVLVLKSKKTTAENGDLPSEELRINFKNLSSTGHNDISVQIRSTTTVKLSLTLVHFVAVSSKFIFYTLKIFWSLARFLQATGRREGKEWSLNYKRPRYVSQHHSKGKAALRRNHLEITHQSDVWHVAKGTMPVVKPLSAADTSLVMLPVIPGWKLLLFSSSFLNPSSANHGSSQELTQRFIIQHSKATDFEMLQYNVYRQV